MIIKATIDEVRAIINAVNDIRRFIGEKVEKEGHSITGSWTNEGDVTAPLPSHYIDVELLVDGKKVSGIVRSRQLQTDSKLPNGLLVGERKMRKIAAEVLDVKRRRLVKYGDITLERKGDFIHWTAGNRVADFLPATAQLWKLK